MNKMFAWETCSQSCLDHPDLRARGGRCGHEAPSDHLWGDKPREECGVFGIYARPGVEVSRLTYLGLFALQHRGQESAGMVTSDGRTLRIHKQMGLVAQVFDDAKLAALPGQMAIGHVRYSTTGASLLANAQPLLVRCALGQVALAHNGNLVNASQLRQRLEQEGSVFQSSSDTEIILNLLARHSTAPLEEAVRRAMSSLVGSYSLVLLTRDKLIGLRDPMGIRPLVLGQRADAYLLASESCAITNLGGEVVREVGPGEMVVIDEEGPRFQSFAASPRQAFCVFEFIYFARPDSDLLGRNVHLVRREIGRELWREAPVAADVVIGAPDSGTSAAMGFAAEAGIPFEIGLIKNRYIGRTFIQPSQELRELGVRIKINPNEALLRGKRVVIIDDSIVRGTTSAKMVKMLREAGAREVHMYVASPAYLHPCYYGIDTSESEELIAANRTVQEIQSYIGADSLHYLSVPGLWRAVGVPQDQLCAACFTGDYPIPVGKGDKGSKYSLE